MGFILQTWELVWNASDDMYAILTINDYLFWVLYSNEYRFWKNMKWALTAYILSNTRLYKE